MDAAQPIDAARAEDTSTSGGSSPTDARMLADAAGGDAALMDSMAADAGSDTGGLVSAGSLCASCASGERLCGGLCVTLSDPEYGCATDTCAPCSPAHAAPTCGPGDACAIGSCEPGWADCDGNPSNGCEANLSSPASCGGCAVVCPGTASLCSPTGCVAACAPPLTTCGNSCVDLTRSPSNCGSCGSACTGVNFNSPSRSGPPRPKGFPTCTGGSCGTDTCFPGFALCSTGQGISGTACADLTLSSSCGSCDHACSVYATNEVGKCANSTCTVQCQLGWTLCGNACVATQTDPINCGTCGRACGSDEMCLSSACALKSSIWLATGLSTPADLATDGTNIYWSDTGNGTINAIPQSGGAVLPLAQNQSKPLRIALDDTHVYWSNNLGGAIMRTLKSGTGTAEVVSAATSPTSIAVDSQYVYFTAGDTIERVTKTGGSPSPFATIPGWMGAQITLNEMLSDGTALYSIGRDSAGDHLWRILLASGAMTNLVSYDSLNAAHPMAVDSSNVYFTNGGNIRHIDWADKLKAAQQARVYVYTGLQNSSGSSTYWATAFAVSACGVFWADATSNLYLTRPGSTYTTQLVTAAANQVIVDGDYIYWTDRSGAIGKLPVQ